MNNRKNACVKKLSHKNDMFLRGWVVDCSHAKINNNLRKPQYLKIKFENAPALHKLTKTRAWSDINYGFFK